MILAPSLWGESFGRIVVDTVIKHNAIYPVNVLSVAGTHKGELQAGRFGQQLRISAAHGTFPRNEFLEALQLREAHGSLHAELRHLRKLLARCCLYT